MNRIEKLAIDLRWQLGVPDDEKIDPVDILRRLKIAGIISSFGPGLQNPEDRVAAQWAADDRSIRVSDELWDNADFADDPEIRFMIAHEVGHAANGHTSRNRKYNGGRQFAAMREQDEIEADDFALAFLMPLTFALTAPIHDADALAQMFGVTRDVAERRMVDLQKYARAERQRVSMTIDEDNYAEAMSEMRKNALSWNAQ